MHCRFHALAALTIVATSCTYLVAQQQLELEENVAKWIADLDSNQFSSRDNATRRLIEMGANVTRPLASAAKSGSRERTQRTLHILRQLGYSAETTNETAARVALRELSESPIAVLARGANESLTSIDRFHQAPAIAALKRLGAKVAFGQRRTQFGAFAPQVRVRNTIDFDQNWTGQPTDLTHLRRLVDLDSITISGGPITETVFDYLADLPKLVRVELNDVKFSDDSLAKLGAIDSLEALYIRYSPFTDRAIPHLVNLKQAKYIELWGTEITEQTVQQLREAHVGIDLTFHRGALLGIASYTESIDLDGCPVREVTKNTAAEAAGILANDLIISVDEAKIESFDMLRATMAKKRHGETVTIRVRRGDKELDLKTKLGSWSNALPSPF